MFYKSLGDLNMKFIFLGTGDADGIPALGCKCEVCKRSIHSKIEQRTRASLLIDFGYYAILLDAAPELRLQLNRLRLSEKFINAVLITHWHFEHWIGLVELHSWDRKRMQRVEPKFTILMNKYTHEQYSKILNPLTDSTNVWLKTRYHIQIVKDYSKIKLTDDIEIIPIPLDHTIPTTGYLIYTPNVHIAYLVDTGAKLSDKTIEYVKECKDYVILDVTWYNKEGKGHMAVPEAINFINDIKPRKAYATHIGHKNLPHNELDYLLRSKTNNVMAAAYDGLVVCA